MGPNSVGFRSKVSSLSEGSGGCVPSPKPLSIFYDGDAGCARRQHAEQRRQTGKSWRHSQSKSAAMTGFPDSPETADGSAPSMPATAMIRRAARSLIFGCEQSVDAGHAHITEPLDDSPEILAVMAASSATVDRMSRHRRPARVQAAVPAGWDGRGQKSRTGWYSTWGSLALAKLRRSMLARVPARRCHGTKARGKSRRRVRGAGSLAEHDFGEAGAQTAVVVDAGEPEIGKRFNMRCMAADFAVPSPLAREVL